MIALTTPAGNIGSKVLTRLLDASSPSVRLLARNPEKVPLVARDRFEVIQGAMAEQVFEGHDSFCPGKGSPREPELS
jgi:uncharacterized protein YbjT (DUF2867 family)